MGNFPHFELWGKQRGDPHHWVDHKEYKESPIKIQQHIEENAGESWKWVGLEGHVDDDGASPGKPQGLLEKNKTKQNKTCKLFKNFSTPMETEQEINSSSEQKENCSPL